MIIAITVVVVAVPEGLPLAVTISLAFSVMKMKKQNNLVRKLHASETMGGADQICTDKTGTLTMNKMTVKQLWSQDQVFKVENFKKNQDLKLLAMCACYNSGVVIEKNGDIKGNCTEMGIVKFIQSLGQNVDKYIVERENSTISSIPFNSERKRATIVIQDSKDLQSVKVFCKGAPEIVFNYCNYFINEEGHKQELTEQKKQEIIKNVVEA
jgi:Ca2+ transporting ATPase